MNRNNLHFFAAACILLGCSTVALQGSLDAFANYYRVSARPAIYGILVVTFLTLGLACFMIAGLFGYLAFMPISVLHTPWTALQHFYHLLNSRREGARLYFELIHSTQLPIRGQQDDVLLNKMIHPNVDTEFGKARRFNEIKTREDFRRNVPLTTFDDYQPYIDRLEKGEQNQLTKEPVIRFCTSSGTTGKPKHLPGTRDLDDRLAWYPKIYRWMIGNEDEAAPKLAPLKALSFGLTPKWRYSEGGIPIGPASVPAPNGQPIPARMFCGTPLPPPGCTTHMPESGQTYLNWLFGLFDSDLVRVEVAWAGVLLTSLEFFRENWKLLVKDIRRGQITNKFDIPPGIVSRLLKKLPPGDPDRADEIERECSKGFEGIVGRLFPRVRYVVGICTGSHEIYVERLQWFCGPKLRLYSWFFGSSEGCCGFNLDLVGQSQAYTLMPFVCFLEFIPEDKTSEDQPETLFMDEIEEGKRYEMVITTPNGFYRYRIGDMVEVVGRTYNAPLVKFGGRLGGLIDLRFERMTEGMIARAVTSCVQSWKARLVEYTVTESLTLAKAHGQQTDRRFYVLFIEMDGFPARKATDVEVNDFDAALRGVNEYYTRFRGYIDCDGPQVNVVKPGTFDKMRKRSLEITKAVANQYKTPRYLKNVELVKILIDESYQ